MTILHDDRINKGINENIRRSKVLNFNLFGYDIELSEWNCPVSFKITINNSLYIGGHLSFRYKGFAFFIISNDFRGTGSWSRSTWIDGFRLRRF